ncbi:MAG: Mfa1 family fimbria major subunit, partial [Bacteroidales bacterium]|nr:Mfa1 family fimbria major subunit [Bacteroidales bacterium]
MKKCFLLAAAAAFALVACNKEPSGPSVDENSKMYMQFSIRMLSTKSSTDAGGNSNSNANPDTEVGKDYENAVSSVDIALVKGDQYFVSRNVTPLAASSDTYVASFSTVDLQPGASYSVYVYVNCSAPASFDVDEVSEATVAQMTQNNKFWMTNAYAAASVTLPASLAPYTKPNTPLDLGSHIVERSMARFDYMAAKKDNVYDMGAGLTITLTDAALINQSKAHYMFRRVTADANTSSAVTVGGVEIPTNWVVDTDWGNKVAANFDAQLEAPSTWDWTSLASLTTDDQYDGDYKIWCYAKENTIPGIDAQKHNVSTGVVFKGELAAGETASTAVKAAMAAKKRIYVFNNVLYGAWSDVKTAAEAGTDPTLQAAYNQAATGVAADAEPTGAAAAAAGFTGYSAKDGKYYNYYYYWNRHNDNLNNNEMDVMEFAVVRNNVYKLAV